MEAFIKGKGMRRDKYVILAEFLQIDNDINNEMDDLLKRNPNSAIFDVESSKIYSKAKAKREQLTAELLANA